MSQQFRTNDSGKAYPLSEKKMRRGAKPKFTTLKDDRFRKWLREEKNIDDRIGTKGSISSYKKEYLNEYPQYAMLSRGERYYLNDKGNIIRTDVKMDFHDDWKVFGVANRWNAHPAMWSEVKKGLDSGAEVKGYLHDIDHGTHRMWGGQYNGKVPTVTIWKMKDLKGGL